MAEGDSALDRGNWFIVKWNVGCAISEYDAIAAVAVCTVTAHWRPAVRQARAIGFQKRTAPGFGCSADFCRAATESRGIERQIRSPM